MRLLIVLCMAAMAFLAAMYLRTRSMRPSSYLSWVMLILFVPVLGPFMAIASRPGVPLKRRS